MSTNPVASEMMLPPGTLSFPNLFVPKKVDEKSDPKYSFVTIWPADALASLQPIKQECAKLLAAKYGPTWLEMVKAGQLKWPFKKIAGLLVKPGYPDGGEFVNFNAAADSQPHLFDRYKDPATGKAAIVTDPKKFYAGCQVVVLARPYLYDKGVNKGVSVGPQAVQWWADGPRLDGRSNPIEKFAAEEAPVAALPASGASAADADALESMLGTAGIALP